MVHAVGKKGKGFIGFLKGDPLLRPFFPEEEEDEEGRKIETAPAVDTVGVDE